MNAKDRLRYLAEALIGVVICWVVVLALSIATAEFLGWWLS